MPVDAPAEVDLQQTIAKRTLPAPLSICLVSLTSAYATGGTAAYIRFVGTAFQRHGHTVRGVSRYFKAQPAVTQYDFIDAVSKAEIDSEAGNGGVPVDLIAPKSGLSRFFLPRLATLLSRPAFHSLGIKLFNYAYGQAFSGAVPADTDVIDYTGNGWEMIGFTALAEARRRGIPFAVLPFVHPGVWGDSPLDIRLYNQADIVFVCSAYETNHLIEKGVRADLLRRTGMAPASSVIGDGARFRAANGLGDRPLVLFIGRKERYKGYHTLCEAMTTILREVPDACLVAIGPETEPPFPAVPSGAILDLGVLAVDSQQKADALAACDVFCMPSEAEAFGIVYVEAWKSRKPVIGGTAPAVRELIEEGVTGYCVTQEPGDVARAVIGVLGNPALGRQMGEAGYALQQSRYDWDLVASGHEEAFREARSKTTAK